MNTDQLESRLNHFQHQFAVLADRYDGTIAHSLELEKVIDDYSDFVTNEDYQKAWAEWERHLSGKLTEQMEEVRRTSSLCVAIMEKYRALKLLGGSAERSDYFHNIESCIEQEFGSFRVEAGSKVVLIGSGSFPMTPLFIAKQTGAAVVGIDIDEEAVRLGRQVVERLGDGLNIRLESTPAEQLGALKDATHIIFSSTVPEKYELLDQFHALTDRQVVVAMRYGDRLKSLFNYPMQPVNERKWRLVDSVLRPGQVFDIALYRHA